LVNAVNARFAVRIVEVKPLLGKSVCTVSALISTAIEVAEARLYIEVVRADERGGASS
jgi:hypothetical protein